MNTEPSRGVLAGSKKYKSFTDYMEDQPRIITPEAEKIRPKPSLGVLFRAMEEARSTFETAMKSDKEGNAVAVKLHDERNAIQVTLDKMQTEKKDVLRTLKGDALKDRLLDINTSLEVLQHQLASKDEEIRIVGKERLTHDDIRNLRGDMIEAEGVFYRAVLEELRAVLPKVHIIQVALAAAVKANWAGGATGVLTELLRGYCEPGPEHWEAVRKGLEESFRAGGALW